MARSTPGCIAFPVDSASPTCSPVRYSRRCAVESGHLFGDRQHRHSAAARARLFGRVGRRADRRRWHARHPDPPSLTFILYGIVTEQSINKLFLAGIGPGILLTVLFAAWVVIKFRIEHKQALAALGAGAQRAAILEDEHYSWREPVRALPRLLPFLLLIAIVMLAMYTGWGTPSEVAAVGALGSLILVMTVYGCWRLRDLKAILSGTMRESTMIMMIIAASFLFSYVMSDLGITQKTAGWLVSLGLGQWQFFLWSCVFMVILGFFLPPVAIILMVMPIILPSLKVLASISSGMA